MTISLRTCYDLRIAVRYAAAQMVDIAYGHSVTSLDDKYIQLAERATRETVEIGSPGSMLVDFFPACE